ncbi:hypothetical protein PAPHI01_2592, partial [Pancytospora philotis]
LLANGEKIAAEYEPKVTSKKKQGSPSAVALVCGERALLKLRLKIDNDTWTKPLYIEEVQTVVDFFVNHGAADVEEYGLHYTDSPGFLMQAYLCEYASGGAFISEVCDCVDALLAEMYSGTELGAVRDRYFTTDDELVREYSKNYALFTMIDEIYSRSGFPFTGSNMPLGNQLVHYRGKRAGENETDNSVSYSDCTEIALYNFFCCMLYDPKTRRYSIEHLRGEGCEPTDRFIDFFTNICTKPEDNSKACIHQAWADVVHGLVPPQAADGTTQTAGVEGELRLIRYCKKNKSNVNVELESDMGTFFAALTKIVGLPQAKRKELEHLLAGGVSSPLDGEDWEKVTSLFSEIVRTTSSPRKVDFKLQHNMSVKGEQWARLYGVLELSFPPQGGDLQSHKFELAFDHKHASFVYKPHSSITLDTKEREFITALGEKIKDEGSSILSDLIRDSAKRFLSMADGVLLLNEHVTGIENARGPLMLYTALTHWLAHVPMRSHKDRLAAIDQVFPTFIEALRIRKGLSGAMDELSANPKGHAVHLKSRPFSAANIAFGARNTVALLISNILGSVPLNDEATRMPFFQAVLANCVDERSELFSNIRIHASLYCPEAAALRLRREEKLWTVSDFGVPNIALHYLRQLAAIGPKYDGSEVRMQAPIVCFLRNFENMQTNGHKIVGMFMRHKHAEGVEFVRGYCTPADTSAENKKITDRLKTDWFGMAIKNKYYSEARRVCDSWGDSDYEFSMNVGATRIHSGAHNFPPLSEGIIAEVFPGGPTPAQFRIFLRAYALFTYNAAHYAGLLGALECNSDKLDSEFVAKSYHALIDAYFTYCEGNEFDCHYCTKRPPQIVLAEPLMEHLCRVKRLCAEKLGGLTGDTEDIFRHCEEKLAECDEYIQKDYFRYMVAHHGWV